MDPALVLPRFRSRLHDRSGRRSDQPARHPPNAVGGTRRWPGVRPRRRDGRRDLRRDRRVRPGRDHPGAGRGAACPRRWSAAIFLLWLAWRTIRAEPHDPATVRARRGGLAGAVPVDPWPDPDQPDDDPVVRGTVRRSRRRRAPIPAGAALVTLGVLLGSSAWWVVLTSVVSALERGSPDLDPADQHRSGIAIGAFALVSIAIAVA